MAEIRRRRQAGKLVGQAAVEREDPLLHSSVRQFFGKWSVAVVAEIGKG